MAQMVSAEEEEEIVGNIVITPHTPPAYEYSDEDDDDEPPVVAGVNVLMTDGYINNKNNNNNNNNAADGSEIAGANILITPYSAQAAYKYEYSEDDDDDQPPVVRRGAVFGPHVVDTPTGDDNAANGPGKADEEKGRGYNDNRRGGYNDIGRGGYNDNGRGGFNHNGRSGYNDNGRGGYNDNGRGGYNDVPRGFDAVPRGINDVPRGINEVPRGMNEVPRGMNDVPRGMNDVPRGMNDNGRCGYSNNQRGRPPANGPDDGDEKGGQDNGKAVDGLCRCYYRLLPMGFTSHRIYDRYRYVRARGKHGSVKEVLNAILDQKRFPPPSAPLIPASSANGKDEKVCIHTLRFFANKYLPLIYIERRNISIMCYYASMGIGESSQTEKWTESGPLSKM